MDNFLDRYQITKLNQDQIDNLNSPITPKGTEVVTECLATKKSTGTDGWLQCRILSDLQRRLNINTLQTVPQNRNRRNTTKLIL